MWWLHSVWGLSWKSQSLEWDHLKAPSLTSLKGDAGYGLEDWRILVPSTQASPRGLLHWASLGFSQHGGWIPQSKHPTERELGRGFHDLALAVTQQHDFCCTQLVGRVASPPSFKRKRNGIYLLIAELKVLEELVGLAIWFWSFWENTNCYNVLQEARGNLEIQIFNTIFEGGKGLNICDFNIIRCFSFKGNILI